MYWGGDEGVMGERRKMCMGERRKVCMGEGTKVCMGPDSLVWGESKPFVDKDNEMPDNAYCASITRTRSLCV